MFNGKGNIMKATIITDAKKLKASIARIRTSGAKLDARIQVAAISVIDHADKHGDTTLADALVNAMPKSGRKLALVEYLLAFGKFEVITAKSADDRKAIEAGRVFKFAKDKVTNLDGADDKMWYDFRKEAKVSDAFDAQSQVKALLSRMNAAIREGKAIENREGAVEQARALLAALEA